MPVEAPDNGVFRFVRDMNEIIFIADTARNIVVASNMAREVFGIPENPGVPLSVEDYLPKVYVDSISQRIQADDVRRMKLTFPVKDAGGREVMLETRFNWFERDGRKLLSITCRDINDVMKEMSDLSEREDRYRTIFRESPIGFIHVNSDGFITDCNNSFTEIFGLEKFEVIGVCLAEDNNLDLYPKFKKAAMDAVVGFSSRHESQFSTSNGQNNGWVRVSFSPVISENRAFLGAIGIVEDITEAKEAVDKISFVSSHDALTGLLNRRMCEEAIKSFERQEYLPLGVIYADLNCLKLANDAFGHYEGDVLLKTAAKILKDNAGDDGEAYRLGGDEFIVLLKEASVESVNECIKRITKTCVGWKAESLVSPSMALGGSVKLYAEQKLGDIIKEAEDTMYANKMKNGKPTRMRILGSLESRLHNMNGSSVGDRSKRIISWGEWFLANANFPCDHDILRLLCRYHDVGLLACPEEISVIGEYPSLAKVAAPMQHMAVGYRIAKCTVEISGVAEYILSHHEWWDGMGYPNQQAGQDIPLESRIISVFDSLEGMLCLRGDSRVTVNEALDALEGSSGRHFDPGLIERIVPLIRNKPPQFLRNLE
ncbi:MAG: diguanylate cyclase [Synergistaceae bacterium]|jgi:diguanylate cyclase (GGDEF)-like protein/PAS domain S-box-containing protein|nr:diguanylate cyclase [Synergistaceae bacterium]